MDTPSLIYKVLSGNATEAEIIELNNWISGNPDHAEEFEELKWVYESALKSEEKMDAKDDRFYEGLHTIQDMIKTMKRVKKRKRRYKMAGMWAGIAVMIFITIIYIFNLIGIPRSTVLVENLTFEEATVESIIDLLEDKYRLVINVSNNELLSCRFTGMFQRGVAIEDVIRTLAQAEEFDYSVVDPKTYEFQGQGCPG